MGGYPGAPRSVAACTKTGKNYVPVRYEYDIVKVSFRRSLRAVNIAPTSIQSYIDSVNFLGDMTRYVFFNWLIEMGGTKKDKFVRVTGPKITTGYLPTSQFMVTCAR
jgi:hypothetical protein